MGTEKDPATLQNEGWFYILHFVEKLHHAQHYTGIARDVDERYREHITGRGAKIVRAAVEAGIKIVIAQRMPMYWPEAPAIERRFKSLKNTPKYCPICVRLKRLRQLQLTLFFYHQTKKRNVLRKKRGGAGAPPEA